jgi:hypothetical protein
MTDFSTTDLDTVLDLGWFEEHAERRYYACRFVLAGATWVALVYRAERCRPARPTMTASPSRRRCCCAPMPSSKRLPETEEACRAARQRASETRP